MSSKVIEVKGLDVGYFHLPTLKNLNFSVNRGLPSDFRSKWMWEKHLNEVYDWSSSPLEERFVFVMSFYGKEARIHRLSFYIN